ncbi:hypothetical protein Acy02nite_85150 [Actinoplanes cyaneus]|uniref:Uncharacterized protein n=1 Tax=Actinoplanes cyaneus TaxID=52696 RepID=A0A919IR25_9ACTN|nr:hypothetical protein Acy02nite_85150 [Actinoplanes cyaneus]
MHFAYLDPAHRAGGETPRLHTLGETMQLAHQPRIVIISENKDIAVNLPKLGSDISAEGVDRVGTIIAALPWLQQQMRAFTGVREDGLDRGFQAVGRAAASRSAGRRRSASRPQSRA